MHQDLGTMMPTFIIEDVFVVVESQVMNQCKDKSLELSLLYYFILSILCFIGSGLQKL
jgi:hypothetical protein